MVYIKKNNRYSLSPFFLIRHLHFWELDFDSELVHYLQLKLPLKSEDGWACQSKPEFQISQLLVTKFFHSKKLQLSTRAGWEKVAISLLCPFWPSARPLLVLGQISYCPSLPLNLSQDHLAPLSVDDWLEALLGPSF